MQTNGPSVCEAQFDPTRKFSSTTRGGNCTQRLLRCRHKMHSYVTSTRRNEKIPMKSKDEAENSGAEAASNHTKIYLRSSSPYLDGVFCKPPIAVSNAVVKTAVNCIALHIIQLLHRLRKNGSNLFGSPSNGAFFFLRFIHSVSVNRFWSCTVVVHVNANCILSQFSFNQK